MSRKAWSKGRVDMGGGLVRSMEAEGKLKSKGISTARLVDMMSEVLVRVYKCMNKDQETSSVKKVKMKPEVLGVR